MGEVNRCLRVVFITFNVFFLVFGCFMVFGTIKVTAYSSQVPDMESPNIGWSWVFSLGMVGISILGIFAGYAEKLLPLKIFAGFMSAGMVIMLIIGIMLVVAKGKLEYALSSNHVENTPMAEAVMQDSKLRHLLEELQYEGHCCGVWSPMDWGYSVPDSCNCTYATEGLASIGLGTSGCKDWPFEGAGPKQIYPRVCGDLIMMILDFVFRLAMGIFFGSAVAALVGLLLSYMMIRQIKSHQEAGGGAAFPMKGQYL